MKELRRQLEKGGVDLQQAELRKRTFQRVLLDSDDGRAVLGLILDILRFRLPCRTAADMARHNAAKEILECCGVWGEVGSDRIVLALSSLRERV